MTRKKATVREKLGLSARDWIWIGTLVVGFIGSYFGIRSEVTTARSEIAELKQRVVLIDARLWDMRGARPSFLGVAPDPCAPDAPALRLTMTEVDYGTDR